jgi:hypothetical protein
VAVRMYEELRGLLLDVKSARYHVETAREKLREAGESIHNPEKFAVGMSLLAGVGGDLDDILIRD